MTTYTGTDGNDNFPGTPGDDIFNFIGNVLGTDVVDGQSGVDELNVDYSPIVSTATGAFIGSLAGSFYGSIYGSAYGNLTNSVTFQNVEKLSLILGAGNDAVEVHADSLLTAGNMLSIDGGSGNNFLEAHFTALNDTQFIVDAAGAILSNQGSYYNFQTFQLLLGGGNNVVVTQGGDDGIYASTTANYDISTGAGDDYVETIGGINHIDTGSGYDQWYANGGGTYTDLVMNWDGKNGTLSNGSTFQNMEYFEFGSGSGDDTFNVSDSQAWSYMYIYGGNGNDTLNASFARTDIEQTRSINSNSQGFYGNISAGSNLFFDGIENLNASFGAGFDTISVDASASLSGAKLYIDGGVDQDWVFVIGAMSGYSVSQDGLGGFIVTDIDASDGDHGSFTVRDFERLYFSDNSFSYFSTYAAGHTIIGTSGNDKLVGTAYNDLLQGMAGNDVIDGGFGNDTASYADALAAVKVNLLLTTSQNTGGSGRDTLISIENLIGSNFNDTLTGNDEDNQLDGGSGNDRLYGGARDDHLIGGAGNDVLDGGTGVDLLDGGLGSDRYYVDDFGDIVIENDPAGGIDTVFSAVDFWLGANVEKLTLTGSTAIIGSGNTLANTIIGNSANNILNGGAGKDVLTGGLGADTFVFDVKETTTNRDTITDFTSGVDSIKISTSAFSALAGYGLGALSSGELSYGTKAAGVNDHLIYNTVNGALYYDADGAGGAAQIQIAVLTGHPTLVASDIVLI